MYHNCYYVLLQSQDDMVGMKIKSSGSRWKLPETEVYYGVVLSERKFRGKMVCKVRWEEDDFVEYIPEKDVREMICGV